MSLFSSYKKKLTLKSAIKQVVLARQNQDAKANQLFLSSYAGFATVIQGNLLLADTLYNWGFALLHQAKTKKANNAVKLYTEAVTKFDFCLLIKPDYLAAAIDAGVAYMDLARIKQVAANDKNYSLAKKFFELADSIQHGSAAYNLACIYSIQEQNKLCLQSLELAYECGSLPETEYMTNDLDLEKVQNTRWFINFIQKITPSKPQAPDKEDVVYDVEGNIIKSTKPDHLTDTKTTDKKI